jgi:predicted negative regulator of RcsB-dependent stress response
MSWAWIIGIAAIGASLYWLVLVGYRLFLSLKNLQAAAIPLQASLKLLAKPLEREFAAAKNTTAEDLGDVLVARNNRKHAKQDAEEARRNRLIARLDHMNIDKR